MTRNVALICLDTVRKDFFDEYAPRLREAGVGFEQCRAASSWSVPSHASMLTGDLPHEHGIHTFDRDFSALDRAETFLGGLPAHRAIGASANVYASSSFGFDTLFDEYSDVSPQRRFSEGIDVGRFAHDFEGSGGSRIAAFGREALAHPHPVKSLLNGAMVKLNDLQKVAPIPKLLDDGARIVSREATRLIEEGDEPFFLFANFMDAHPPLQHTLGYDRDLHSAPNGWTTADVDDETVRDDGKMRRRYCDLYAAAMDYLDRRLNDLIDEIRAITERDTTVIVTADHGQNLGHPADEGLVGHVKTSLTEGVLHVPLRVVNPPEGYAPVANYVTHLDLPELVVGMANGEHPAVSRDWVPAEVIGIGDADPDRGRENPRWDRTIRCAYEGETKYVWDTLGARNAYELDHGRACWQRQVGEDVELPGWATEFFEGTPGSYRERVRDGGRDDDSIDTATRDRLNDLGYL